MHMRGACAMRGWLLIYLSVASCAGYLQLRPGGSKAAASLATSRESINGSEKSSSSRTLPNGAEVFFSHEGSFKDRNPIGSDFITSGNDLILTIPTLCCSLAEAIDNLKISSSGVEYKEGDQESGSFVSYEIKVKGGAISADKKDARMQGCAIVLRASVTK